VRIRDSLGISERRQRQLAGAMEVALVGMLFVGIYLGQLGIAVNAGVGLLVTQLVPVLERDYQVPMDAGLVLWITSAVFLHALGTVPLPAEFVEPFGTVDPARDRISLYQARGVWDHMTHMLSSSIVAAAGYSTVRALDQHSEEIHIPSRYMLVFIVLFVLAFGVFWEVIEFAIGGMASVFGGGQVLTQYGAEDTLRDMAFNTLGGLLVGLFGTAYLSDVVGAIERKFEARSGR